MDAGQIQVWVAVIGGTVAVVSLLLSIVTLFMNVGVRRRQQASLVNVIHDQYSIGWRRAEDGEGPVQHSEMQVRVVNSSPQPVYRIVVRLLDWNWKKKRRIIRRRWYIAIGPDSTSQPADLGPLPEFKRERGDDFLDLPIEVAFTDAAGLRWRRSPNGRLRRVYRWWPLPADAD